MRVAFRYDLKLLLKIPTNKNNSVSRIVKIWNNFQPNLLGRYGCAAVELTWYLVAELGTFLDIGDLTVPRTVKTRCCTILCGWPTCGWTITRFVWCNLFRSDFMAFPPSSVVLPRAVIFISQENFIKQHPGVKSSEYGDVDSRIRLRKDLKCKSFAWYLKHVYPELVLPSDDNGKIKKKLAALEQDNFQPWHLRRRNYVSQYQIRLSNTSLCVQSEKDTKTKGGGLILKPCVRAKNQVRPGVDSELKFVRCSVITVRFWAVLDVSQVESELNYP